MAKNDRTSKKTIDLTVNLLKSSGKVPVLCNNSPGFIVPRLQTTVMNEAVRILEENVASAEDIDKAIKLGFGFRLSVLGLIEFIDLGGIDILYDTGQYLSGAFNKDQFVPPPSVKEKISKNELGPKTGKGYYDYDGVDLNAVLKEKYKSFFRILDLNLNKD